MHWCWQRAARRLGLTLRTFSLPTKTEDPDAIVSAAVRAMTPETRLFFFSHVLSPTGLVLPVRVLAIEAKARGILTVIDGAHAAAFTDVNLADIPCDFYTGNCHKWLLAPIGCGFLHFAPDKADLLEPMQVSWGYHFASEALDERDAFGSTPRLRWLEFEGTRDICPWLTVPEAIDFQSALGFSEIRARQRKLVQHVRRQFGWLPVATPENPALCGAMTAFELPKHVDPCLLREQLWAKRIEALVVERPDRLLLRISTHFYNTEAEIDRLADALPRMVGSS
jgi:isopenicillin-N epimerase